MVWRVDKELVRFPIHHHQHGFLSHKSTESALSHTVNFIERNLARNQVTLGVFLDISSAFNSILPDQISSSLLAHNAPEEAVKWYNDYITNRHVSVTLQGQTRRIKSCVGFPQGGAASAKFWLIAFDQAIRIINSHSITGHGFADDLCALISDVDLHKAQRKMQRMLNELTNWGRTCGLYFNSKKTVAICFTRRKHDISIPKLVIDGQPVAWSNTWELK
jgi:hypothetical protein